MKDDNYCSIIQSEKFQQIKASVRINEKFNIL